MSKYYKAEDVERLIENIINVMIGKEEPMETALSDLPTIEVSEDCISKAYLEQEIENQIMIVNDEHWRGWNNALDKVVELIEDAPSVAPSREDIHREKEQAYYKGYEDAREWVKGICEDMLDEEMLGHMLGYIENAPSVVVRNNRTTAEPQTYITEDRDTQILDAWQVHHRNTTTVEDEPTTEQSSMVGKWIKEYNGNGWNDYWDYTCSNCGKKYERADSVLYHSSYCPNCGARMKGAEDE